VVLDPSALEFDEGRRFPICQPSPLAELLKRGRNRGQVKHQGPLLKRAAPKGAPDPGDLSVIQRSEQEIGDRSTIRREIGDRSTIRREIGDRSTIRASHSKVTLVVMDRTHLDRRVDAPDEGIRAS
jgi:hypothetical protein